VSGILAGNGRIRERSSASRSIGTARIVRCTLPLTFSVQASSPVLIVEVVGEHPARLEVRAHEAVRSLELTLRLRISGLEDHPAELELTAEQSERLGRTAAGGDRRLAVPDQLVWQRSEPPQVARQPEQDVRCLLGEDQAGGDRARPTDLAGHHPAAPELAVTDRDRLTRLPQVALHELARPVDRALEGPWAQVPRADLADEVVKDRLAAGIAELLRQLPEPLRLDPRISLKPLADPVLERIERRGPRRP
jgi:hypothetical protein